MEAKDLKVGCFYKFAHLDYHFEVLSKGDDLISISVYVDEHIMKTTPYNMTLRAGLFKNVEVDKAKQRAVDFKNEMDDILNENA